MDLQRNDLPNALDALNSADSELLTIYPMGLSGGGTIGEDEESGEVDE
jgi:hypothetical protein